MGDIEKFHDWLMEQDYWVEQEKVEEKAQEHEVEFRRMVGITVKAGDNGKVLVPRRDYRRHLKV